MTKEPRIYKVERIVSSVNGVGLNSYMEGFPGGAVVGSLPANAGDTGSILGPGRSHMPWSN